MKVSLKNGLIRTCECCGLNHYEKQCIKCGITFMTRNANSVKYCSYSCSKKGRKLTEEHKQKIRAWLLTHEKKGRFIKKYHSKPSELSTVS